MKKLAIATSLLLVIPLAPAQAQLETIDSQTTTPTTTPTAVPNNSVPAPSGESVPVGVTETDYTLGSGDQIRLDIFQVEEYSGSYPVLVDGTISLPLVGNVNVEGLTLKQTSDLVSQKYSTYLKRPIVTVGLVAPRPLKIGISGEVDNPGSYEIALSAESPNFPTVTDMIEQAGGITTLADVRRVQVTRTVGNKQMTFDSDLWSLLTRGRLDQDISLRDGDTIFMPTVAEIDTAELTRLSEASFGLQSDEPIQVAVVGEIYRPGSLTVQPLQNANNQNGNNNNNNSPQGAGGSLPPRLSQAIQQAGGIKPLANVEEVEVRRKTWDGEEKIIAVNLWDLFSSANTDEDILLQEGDRIIIPQATALSPDVAQKQAEINISRESITVNVVGEVVTPGAQTVPPNTPLNQAILAAGGFDDQRAQTAEVELVRLQPNGTVDKRKIKVDLASDINEDNNPLLRHNDVVLVSRSGLTKVTDTAGKVVNPIGGAFGVLRLLFGF